MRPRTFIAVMAALVALVAVTLALGIHLGWSTVRHHVDADPWWQDDDIVELWSRR